MGLWIVAGARHFGEHAALTGDSARPRAVVVASRSHAVSRNTPSRQGVIGGVGKPSVAGASRLALLLGIAIVAAACGGDTRPSVASVASDPPTTRIAPAPTAPASATPAPAATPVLPSDPRLDALAAARARWETRRPATFAYTVRSWNSSGFGAYSVRVTSLEGAIRVQPVEGQPWPGAPLVPDGLFDLARRVLASPGTAEIAYDATTGLPTRISASGPPLVCDADTNITLSDFAAPPAFDRTAFRRSVAWALTDWRRAAPHSFSYTWTRTRASASTPDEAFTALRTAGGAVAVTPAAAADGTVAASVASIPATLTAADAAAAPGAWVDLTLGTPGVPLLVAVDPTPAAGDAYWIQIAFRDVEREQAWAAYQEARERWAAAAITRYRYVWHYRGDRGTYTYRVVMRGDVSRLIRSKGSAVLWQAFDAGPRLDVLLGLLDREIASGGRVVATYDARYGFPRKVTLVSVGEGPSGTITISAFVVE